MIDWFVHHAPLIALCGFFIGFIGIILWAFVPANKEKLKRHGQIPFME